MKKALYLNIKKSKFHQQNISAAFICTFRIPLFILFTFSPFQSKTQSMFKGDNKNVGQGLIGLIVNFVPKNSSFLYKQCRTHRERQKLKRTYSLVKVCFVKTGDVYSFLRKRHISVKLMQFEDNAPPTLLPSFPLRQHAIVIFLQFQYAKIFEKKQHVGRARKASKIKLATSSYFSICTN